jgi:hypothetical protein
MIHVIFYAGNVEREILQLCRELDRNTIAGSSAEARQGGKEVAFVLDVSLSVPRIAVCLSSRGGDGREDRDRDRDREGSPSKSRFRHHSPMRPAHSPRAYTSSPRRGREDPGEGGEGSNTLFTLALYGFSTSFTKDERNDKTMHLRLGSVFMFGVNGTNILTCGSEETDKWLQQGEVGDDTYAIESSFQWRETADPGGGGGGEQDSPANSDSEVECDLLEVSEMDNLTRLMGTSKTHCVVVLAVASVKMRWDEPTHLLFHQIGADLSSKFLHLDTPKLFLEQKALCAQLSVNKSSLMDLSSRSKYSAEISVHGIVYECPCVGPSGAVSAPAPYTPYSARRRASEVHRKTNFIRLLVRSFKVCGGDFLPKVQSYSKLEEELHNIPARSLWPSVDYLTEVLLGKLNCSVVHPFIYSLNAIELQFVTVTKRGGPGGGGGGGGGGGTPTPGLAPLVSEEVETITGSPWSVSMVMSRCDILAHPIFPALRLDIFCSPLKLSLSIENMPTIVQTINFLVSYFVNSQDLHGAPRHLSPLQAPRVRNLAPLCKYRIDFHLDLFDIKINANDGSGGGGGAGLGGFNPPVAPLFRSAPESGASGRRAGTPCGRRVMEKVLQGLGDTAAMSGAGSVATAAKLELCIQRLCLLSGKPRVLVAATLTDFVRQVSRGEGEAERAERIDQLLDVLSDGSSKAHPTPDPATAPVELFGASLSGIHCNLYSLMYDSKLTVQLQDVSVTDCDGYSVCSIRPTLSGAFSDSQTPTASHFFQFGDGTMTMSSQATSSLFSGGGRRYSSPFSGEPAAGRRKSRNQTRRERDRDRDRDRDRGGGSSRRRHSSSSAGSGGGTGPRGTSPVRQHRSSRRTASALEVDAEAVIRERAGRSSGASISAFCGVVVTFMEQDKHAGWGVGGGSVALLYDTTFRGGLLHHSYDAHDVAHVPFRLRENIIAADVKRVEAVASPCGMTRFARDVVPIFILSYPAMDRRFEDEAESDYDSSSEDSFYEGSDYSSYGSRGRRGSRAEEAASHRRSSRTPCGSVANSWSCRQLAVESCQLSAIVQEKMFAMVEVKAVDIEWRQTFFLARAWNLREREREREGDEREYRSEHPFADPDPNLDDEGGRGFVDNSKKWLSSSHRFAVGGLCAYDLSDEGRSHVDVLWKDPKYTKDVFLLTGVSTDKKSSFTCAINGLRCTFLWRFLFEIIELSFEHLFLPVSLALKTNVLTAGDLGTADGPLPSPRTPGLKVESKIPNFDNPVSDRGAAAGGVSMNGSSDDSEREFSDADMGDRGMGGDRLSFSDAGDVDDNVSAVSETKAKPTFWAKVWQTKWHLQMNNTTLILPRNSHSEDLACVVVNDIVVQNRMVHEPWGPPPLIGPCASHDDSVKNSLHFDIQKNAWAWDTAPDEQVESPSIRHMNSSGGDTFMELLPPGDGLVLVPPPETQLEGEAAEDVAQGRSRVSTEGSFVSLDTVTPRASRVPFALFGAATISASTSDPLLASGPLVTSGESITAYNGESAESADADDSTSANSGEYESCYDDETCIPDTHADANGDEDVDLDSMAQSSVTLKKDRQRRDSGRSNRSEKSAFASAASTNNDSDDFVDAPDHISSASDEEVDLLRQYYTNAATSSTQHRAVPAAYGDNATVRSSHMGSPGSEGVAGDYYSGEEDDDWTINTGEEEEQSDCGGSVFRLTVSLSGAQLFASIAEPLHQFDEPNIFAGVDGDKKYAEVKNHGHVFLSHSAGHSAGRREGAARPVLKHSRQTWQCVSKDPFNLQIVVDTTAIGRKWLISDTDIPSPLALKCTLAEWYLILSIYFDNMAETPVFFDSYREPRFLPDYHFPVHPEYGSRRYWEYIRLRTPITEFLFSRQTFTIDCSLDSDNFPMELPCLSFVNLVSKLGLYPHSAANKPGEALSFANVSLFKTVVHCKVDLDVTQVVVSAGGMEVRDTRSPIRSLFPVVLSVFPLVDAAAAAAADRAERKRTHSPVAPGAKPVEGELVQISTLSELTWGVPDFDFGLKAGPGAVTTAVTAPLTVTYFGAGNTWSCSNVGIDAPSFDIKNLDIVYLVDEYFSMYFRNAQFGHPGLAAYSKISKELWPYGGVDTRVFVTRPHIQIQENPLASNTQILVVSAESGVYFRYLYDSELSLRMDCAIAGLSAVLLKTYRAPVVARSYRGSAGSGKGVRTLIESVHFNWNYHYCKPKDHLDVIASVAPVKIASRAQAHKRWESIPAQNTRPFTAPKKVFSPDGSARRPSMPGNGNGNGNGDFLSPMSGYSAKEAEEAAAEGANTAPFVDFDGERSAVKLPPFYVPKTVLPLLSSQRTHNVNYAYFVSSYEDVLLAITLVMDFLGLPNMWAEASGAVPASPAMAATNAAVEDVISVSQLPSLFCIVRVSETKMILVDDVLGMHLPIFQCNVSEVACCVHRSAIVKTQLLKDLVMDEMVSSAEISARERMSRRNSVPARGQKIAPVTAADAKAFNRSSSSGAGGSASVKHKSNYNVDPPKEEGNQNSNPKSKRKNVLEHMRSYGHASFGGDYFNNIKKCWEPLLAPFSAVYLYEESANRGLGVTLRFTSALRLNASVALVSTLHDALRAVQVANETARDEYLANKADGDATVEDPRPHSAGGKGTHVRRSSHDGHTVLSGATGSNGHGSGHGSGGHGDAVSLPSDYPDREREGHREGGGGNGYSHANGARVTVGSTKRMVPSVDEQNTLHMGIHRRPSRYNHVPTPSLSHNARVGFSILNLTGQPLRYVQYFSSSRATMVHYLEHNQRGLLNFVASKTSIRNNQVVEEQFGHFKQESLQRLGQKALQNTARRSKEVGHHIAVQVGGYKWLSSLQADALGIHFKDLTAVLGSLNAPTTANDAYRKRHMGSSTVTSEEADRFPSDALTDWRTKNALKLVAEVRPHVGGRMLLLRSAFAVKNSTTHDINIITNFFPTMPDPPSDGRSEHFFLKSGETFFIPLSLINESVLRCHGKRKAKKSMESRVTQLGSLWLRPSTLKPVKGELGPSSEFVKSISYSGDPIILSDVVANSELQDGKDDAASAERASAAPGGRTEASTFLADGSFKQLSCMLSTRVADSRGEMFSDLGGDGAPAGPAQGKDDDMYGLTSAPVVNSDKLPPFCYNIEVQRSGSVAASQYMGQHDRSGGGFMSMFSSGRNNQEGVSMSPLQYTIGELPRRL